MRKTVNLIAIGFFVLLSMVSAVEQASAFGFGACMGRGGGFGPPGALPGMPPGPLMGRMFRVMAALELTRDQREEIWTILDEHRPRVRTHLASLFDGRQQLLNFDPAVSGEDQLRGLADSQAMHLTEVFYLMAQTRFRIRSVLTPEQQEKLSALIAGRCGDLPE